MIRQSLLAALCLTAAGPLVRAADDFERDPINYSQATPDNVVSRLQQRLEAGQASLKFDGDRGYIDAVLNELNVPVSSQVLVFSKTSLQRSKISAKTPRALYFNDEVYIGFCQSGDVVEVSVADPQLGTVFYSMDQDVEEPPKFLRQTDACLLCHGSSNTHYVPGHTIRSVFADAAGQPILAAGTHRTDHTSPLKERWGGWYVTGTHGEQEHLGNLVVRTKRVPDKIDNSAGQNVTDLSTLIDVTPYPAPHSDLVALMVLEHQADAHNFLTRANFETRMALQYEKSLNRELGEAPDHRWDSTKTRIKSSGEALVKYLLFSGEAKLTGPIHGTSGFEQEFPTRGPRDSQGRSLRDFDLQTRLFKYPCSYLVYSPTFDGLPGEMKDFVLRRMYQVLTGEDSSKEFSHLSAADRQAILEILRETKPDLPEYWRTAPAASATGG